MPRDYIKDPETIPAPEYDALQISEWLRNREFEPILPASADWGQYRWAHENVGAWAMVDLPEGMTVTQAQVLMVTRAMFDSRSRTMARLRAEQRFNPYHDNKGRFASKGAGGGNSAVQARIPGDALSQDEVHDLYEDVKNKGGFTYNVNTAHYKEEGYAVSPYPMYSREIALYDFSPEDIHQYALENQTLLHSADHYLGAWHDKGPDTVWLDVVVVKGNKADAIALAKEHNQKAIFDLGNLEEIDTGGSGLWRSTRDLEPSNLERSVSIKASACEACRSNSDPTRVPVHPGCHCDVNTDTVGMGIEPEEMQSLLTRHGESRIEAIGLDELPEAVDLMAGTASVFRSGDFRFGDLLAWTRAHDLAELPVGTLTVLIKDGPHVVVARGIGHLLAEAAAAALILSNIASDRANSPAPGVILIRADATPEQLAAAYQIILEGQ